MMMMVVVVVVVLTVITVRVSECHTVNQAVHNTLVPPSVLSTSAILMKLPVVGSMSEIQ